MVPNLAGSGGRTYYRDDIFRVLAAPLLNDGRYRDKVRYGPSSMCIKVDLGIKIEILPVVFKAGNADPNTEPFALYRPSSRQWADGFARYHQAWLTHKNRSTGNFIPSIKVLKLLRSRAGLDAVSFHIECLLFTLPDNVYQNGPADYIPAFLRVIAGVSAEVWYLQSLRTPCGEREIFSPPEWNMTSWRQFHNMVVGWSRLADTAAGTPNRDRAIATWKALLGDELFPS